MVICQLMLCVGLQMIVGFFAGDGDYNDVGALLNIMSAEYPATWFYTVDTGHAQEVADRCNISSTPTVQVHPPAARTRCPPV